MEEFGLSDAVTRIAGVPGIKIALVSDTPELFAAHQYFERLAGQRGLQKRPFGLRQMPSLGYSIDLAAETKHAGAVT